jgi:nitrate/nitrite transporter NarK
MFVVLVAIGLVFVAIYWFTVKGPQQREEVSEQSESKQVTVKELLTTAIMWKLVIAYFGLAIAFWGFASWLPAYLLKARNHDLLQAGFISSLPMFAGGIATLLGGWIVDKYFVNREKYFSIVVLVLSAFFLYFMFKTPSLELAVTYQILSSFFLNAGIQGIWSLPVKILPTPVMGTAAAMINFGGQVAGFISPMVMGFFITAFNGSYDAAFWFLIVSIIISVIACFTIGNGRLSLESK